MASVQGSVYGHADAWGIPFDFYSTEYLVSSGTYAIAMQTGLLVLQPGGACTVNITLPLNPPDGAWAVISNMVGAAGTVTVTVAANTGDSLAGTAFTDATAGTTAQYRYSLNGDAANGQNPRTWVRVQ